MNKKLLYIPAAVLFIGIFPMPIVYYTLLKLVVTAAAAYATYEAFQMDEESGWMDIWVIGAVLFNPFAPFYFIKAMWMIIDFATAILFIVFSRKIR